MSWAGWSKRFPQNPNYPSGKVDFGVNTKEVSNIELGNSVYAYLFDEKFDPACLSPGEVFYLYCEDVKKGEFAIQGKCQVVSKEKVQEGKLYIAYYNTDLINMLKNENQ